MKQKEFCQSVCVNQPKVGQVQKKLPSPDKINALSEIFQVISDNTRLKILLALSRDELCVCDIAAVLNMSLSAVSHQLRLLRNTDLVKYVSQGRMVLYSLKDKHVIKLINEGMKHAKHGRI